MAEVLKVKTREMFDEWNRAIASDESKSIVIDINREF